jgi:hypothetical protein
MAHSAFAAATPKGVAHAAARSPRSPATDACCSAAAKGCDGGAGGAPCPHPRTAAAAPAPATTLASRLSSAFSGPYPPRADPVWRQFGKGKPTPWALLALLTLLLTTAALSLAALGLGHAGHVLHYRGRVVRLSIGGSAPLVLDEGALGVQDPVSTGFASYQPTPGEVRDLKKLSAAAKGCGIALAVLLALSAAAALGSAVAAAAGLRGRPGWALAAILLPIAIFALLIATYLTSLGALAGGLRARGLGAGGGGLLGGLVRAEVTADQAPGDALALAAAAAAAWLLAVIAALLVPRGEVVGAPVAVGA